MAEVKEVCENNPYPVRHKVAEDNQVFHEWWYADCFMILANSWKKNNSCQILGRVDTYNRLAMLNIRANPTEVYTLELGS